MRFVLLVVGALSVSGCVTAAPPAPPPTTSNNAPHILSPSEYEAVKAGVSRGLKDPTSPLFDTTFVAAISPEKLILVCGRVNAKNSYGGYTGDKWFYAAGVGTKFALIGLGDTKISHQAVVMECNRNVVSAHQAAQPSTEVPVIN